MTHSVSSLSGLPPVALEILNGARRGVLGTIDRDGAPHLVPVTFAVRGEEILTAIDQKPKTGRRPARLRNIEKRTAATFMADRWDEEWTRLGWVMVRGEARIDPAGSANRDLGARYEHYEADPPGGEVIAIEVRRVLWWTWEQP